MHVLIARIDDNEKNVRWGAWCQEAPGCGWSMIEGPSIRLQPTVETALDFAFKTRQPMDTTFSTRSFEAVSGNIAMAPEEIDEVDLRVQITMLMAEGRFDGDNRWKTVYRYEKSGHLACIGSPEAAFRVQALKQSMLSWFEPWASFGPRTPGRPETDRPPYEREIYSRHGGPWRARLLCSGDFPEFRDGPVVTDEQAARRISRMPQSKSALRRAKHQQADIRFKAEAAERAKQREAAT